MSVIELSDNKQNYEIVNFFKVDEKRFNEYLKRAEHEGGEVLITKKNDFQGAARLSALESDSYKKVGASSASITPLEVTSETSTDTNSISDNSETFNHIDKKEYAKTIKIQWDEFDKSALNHIINRHGKTENYRNQIPITNDDIKNIPDVIYNADNVEYSGKNEKGLDTF